MAANLVVSQTYTETLNVSDERDTQLKIPQTYSEVLAQRDLSPSVRPSMVYSEVLTPILGSTGAVFGRNAIIQMAYAEVLMNASSKKRSNPVLVQFDAMKREI